MNKAILDTDILSEIVKGVDQTVAAHARTYRRSFGRYTLSVVTLMEVLRGYQKKQAFRQLQTFLAVIPATEILTFEMNHAKLAGVIAGELERTGRPIGLADVMIAATAIDQDLELVTANLGHYRRIQRSRIPAGPQELAGLTARQAWPNAQLGTFSS